MMNRAIALTAVLVVFAANAGEVEEPRLSLDPSSGPPGGEVNASGSGFLNSPCGVDLFLDSTTGPLLGFASIDDGIFSTTIVIPGDTATGQPGSGRSARNSEPNVEADTGHRGEKRA
jgi:hypothetical protein